MAILQKLKSLLGFDDSESERGGTREVGVTVEREGTRDDDVAAVDTDRDESADDAGAEPPQSAATGSSTGDSSESTPIPEESDEPSATTGAETADTSSTAESTDIADESPVQEAEPDVATETEPDAEADPDTEDTESETADSTDSETEAETEPEPESDAESEPETEAEPEPDAESEPETEAEPEPDAEPEEANQEPVVEIKGIGPAYADRLAGAGVDTIGELAAADAAELAEQTDISETRIQGWIDRAEVR